MDAGFQTDIYSLIKVASKNLRKMEIVSETTCLQKIIFKIDIQFSISFYDIK